MKNLHIGEESGSGSGRVGSGQTFCRQSRVGSGRVNVLAGRVGSGPRKVTRGQLWVVISEPGGLLGVVESFCIIAFVGIVENDVVFT